MPIPQQRDPEETRTKLARWLQSQMPGASALEITGLTPPAATGFSNDTLLFDAAWDQDGQRREQGFVARIKPSGYAVFPEYDLRLQYNVMQILAQKSDVPVPKMYWFEDDESVLGAPFYVMGKVEGQIPGDNPPYHVAGWVTEITPQDRAEFWWNALDAMARIHKLDWQKLGFDFLERPQLGPPGLVQQMRYYDDYFRWAARGKAQPITEKAWEWLKANLPDDQPVSLCWGDARIGNMIFRDNKVQAVLDWEMVTLGDPQQDLAWWLFLDKHHSEGLGTPRLEGFPTHAATIARYEELMQRQLRHMKFYEVFAGFRFAVVMMRVAQMMISYEVLPPDSDLETNNIVTQLLAKILGLDDGRIAAS